MKIEKFGKILSAQPTYDGKVVFKIQGSNSNKFRVFGLRRNAWGEMMLSTPHTVKEVDFDTLNITAEVPEVAGRTARRHFLAEITDAELVELA